MTRAASKTKTPAGHRRSFRACGWLVAGLLLGSGLALENRAGLQAAVLRPANVFVRLPVLPAHLRRVAVLPLAAESQGADLPEGCEALQPVLLDELARTKKFEVVSVNPESLRGGSGRAAWTGAEPLPAGFWDALRREYGCDAVLFCQLTVYRAYAPLAVGWRLKLADARTRKILWAADEVFDTGKPDTSRKFWTYLWKRDPAAEASRWITANSPRKFGRDTVAALFGTLPER